MWFYVFMFVFLWQDTALTKNHSTKTDLKVGILISIQVCLCMRNSFHKFGEFLNALFTFLCSEITETKLQRSLAVASRNELFCEFVMVLVLTSSSVVFNLTSVSIFYLVFYLSILELKVFVVLTDNKNALTGHNFGVYKKNNLNCHGNISLNDCFKYINVLIIVQVFNVISNVSVGILLKFYYLVLHFWWFI